MTLDSPVSEIKGVGEAAAKRYKTLGISTIGDLIEHYPRRYEDYSVVTSIAQLTPGPVTIKAVIKQVSGRYVRRGMHVTEAVASDDSGCTRLIWFNQPYRAASLKSGQEYYISGQYELNRQRFSLIAPNIEAAGDIPTNTARILPVYKETKGLTSRMMRAAVQQILPVFDTIEETLPKWIIKEADLLSRREALQALHAPRSSSEINEAKRRIGFEEVFGLTLASLLNKQEIVQETALTVRFDENMAREFVSHLPFQLTDDQRRTIWKIYLDMQKRMPMNRLVEGDVGSGKTVVAAMAALMVLAKDWQAALMAPTELLARQHHESLQKFLRPLGKEGSLQLLTGSMTAAEKTAAHERIAQGMAGFLIGTHALIQETVDMHKLALIIIDEQHRFGVDQRKTLIAKAGHMPHVLSLTATPIPRSLALTLYGELDISLLKEKPGGRLPIITELVSPNSRAQIYEGIDEQLAYGRQMFVVCPLISDSDALEARSAESVYESLRKGPFKHRRIGLLHGKQKAQEKQTVMEQFVRGELDILVSTTVIEVGVDVPNANIMMIESAERFGLAQLHQLRGRVGRGSHQSFCYLMLSDSKAPSRRLRALESSNDGFRLAELDLEIRGPGAIYGQAQHGQLDLRVARLTDTELIAQARELAQKLIDSGEDLLQYKQLMDSVGRLRALTSLN